MSVAVAVRAAVENIALTCINSTRTLSAAAKNQIRRYAGNS